MSDKTSRSTPEFIGATRGSGGVLRQAHAAAGATHTAALRALFVDGCVKFRPIRFDALGPIPQCRGERSTCPEDSRHTLAPRGMSTDETMVLVVCAAAGLVTWGYWYWQSLAVAQFGTRSTARRALLVVPPICAILLYAILKAFSAEDVRYDSRYLAFYLVMGTAWVGLSRGLLALVGLSARDDVIERSNPAAATAIGGALVGLTLCFAGGNIGNGPGWWVVVYSGALATTAFLLVWVAVARGAGLADTITIERDPAAGTRAAGLFVGAGLVLGRSVAGDWSSVEATTLEFFKLGWPVVLIGAVAMFLESRWRPGPGRRRSGTEGGGWPPAIGYAGMGVVFVVLTGWWR